ncbi:MAG: hypothetical protein M1828_006750 [Chrysothrix sp. TS-e1954]|nr:MAG: hypothetical protein M1828_006750 [Chrysothrix sp. TS-e1954]
MGLASFLAGMIPMSFGLSQNHSRIVSTIGTGLLIGTCLIIIIPEGIETLYSSNDLSLHIRFRRQTHELAQKAAPTDPHAFIGISLILGFTLMYLIDQIPRHANTTSGSKPLHISLANLSQGPHRASSPSRTEEAGQGSDAVENSGHSQNSATTIGLVIHAAADGIALAASSFISESSVGIVVFLALMVHKAPAAFGLTSVLLKQGFTKRQARAHLVVFSLAAPIGAITTWAAVNLIAGGRIEGESTTKFWTGLILLFSGGTFLYVAMHTMQEEGVESHGSHSNGYLAVDGYTSSTTNTGPSQKHPSLRDTMLAVVGMLLPLLAQIGHAH